MGGASVKLPSLIEAVTREVIPSRSRKACAERETPEPREASNVEGARHG